MKLAMKLAIVACGIAAVVTGCSCTVDSEGSSRVQGSPNGTLMAYLLDRGSVVQAGPEPVTTRQEVSICWFAAETPGKVKSVQVATWGRDKSKGGYSLSGQTHFAFSQDASRLAIVYPAGLMFIETATGKTRRHKLDENEIVASLAWLDNRTVGYSSYRHTKTDSAVHVERTMWRQDVNVDIAGREVILYDGRIDYYVPTLLYAVDGWPLEFWSPDGRFVLMAGADEKAEAQLLSVGDKTVHKLAGKGYLKSATWAQDGSRVLWYTGLEGQHHAYLYSIAKKDSKDLTDQWRKLFGTSEPGFELLWTPDNRFVAGSNLAMGGYLLSPDPWEVRLIGEKLKKPGDAVPPYLRSQAVPDMLVVDLDPDELIVDYTGRPVKNLGQEGGMSGWTVLPGGKKAVSVGPGNQIAVKALE